MTHDEKRERWGEGGIVLHVNGSDTHIVLINFIAVHASLCYR